MFASSLAERVVRGIRAFASSLDDVVVVAVEADTAAVDSPVFASSFVTVVERWWCGLGTVLRT